MFGQMTDVPLFVHHVCSALKQDSVSGCLNPREEPPVSRRAHRKRLSERGMALEIQRL